MSIETPCFLYPVRFSASSYDLVIDHGGTNEILNLTIEPDRDYWFSGDSVADDSSGNGDLVKWLEDSLNSTTIPGQSFTVSLSFPDERGSNRITVEGSLNFSILWDDAQTTLDASIFGSDGAATPSDLATTFSRNTSGTWSPGYPPWTDSRNQQPITGALSRSVSGLVRGSFFGLPNKERDLVFDMVNREKTLEEFRDTDQDVHGTIEDLWIRAGCLGRRIRYYPDELSRASYSVYRFRDSGHPFERSSIDPYHWTTTLRLVLESTVEAEDGEEEEEEGSIPLTITARDSLAHWWKMNEGSTTAETDYGLAATADTNMMMSGVTSSAGGPTENGTPAMIEFDGVSDDAYILLVDSGGTPTAVGDIFNSVPNTWSLSLWLKDESTTNSTYKTWWKGGATWSQGMGVYASGSSQIFWIKSYNGYMATKLSAVPTSGWRNIIVTFPDVSVSDGYMYIYFDGVEAASLHMGAGAHTVVNTHISSTANTRLSFGCATAPNGTENYHQACAMSDIRVYNKTLSSTEAAAIAAGDW